MAELSLRSHNYSSSFAQYVALIKSLWNGCYCSLVNYLFKYVLILSNELIFILFLYFLTITKLNGTIFHNYVNHWERDFVIIKH